MWHYLLKITLSCFLINTLYFYSSIILTPVLLLVIEYYFSNVTVLVPGPLSTSGDQTIVKRPLKWRKTLTDIDVLIDSLSEVKGKWTSGVQFTLSRCNLWPSHQSADSYLYLSEIWFNLFLIWIQMFHQLIWSQSDITQPGSVWCHVTRFYELSSFQWVAIFDSDIQGWGVTKYRYIITVLKHSFQVSVLHSNINFSDNFLLLLPTFEHSYDDAPEKKKKKGKMT